MLANIGALGLLCGALFLITHPEFISSRLTATNTPTAIYVEQTATVIPASSTPVVTQPEPRKIAENEVEMVIEQELELKTASSSEQTASAEVQRINDPYPFAPQDSNTLNQAARAALVNIICEAPDGSVKSISGSGTIIDPRGVIITNAHVAQYILLSRNTDLKIKCRIRAGSPAKEAWTPDIIFFPSGWIKAHAKDILETRPIGTGENDYALVLIVASIDGTALPATFPHLEPDVREKIGFSGDPVLIAAYPAEFGGSSAARNALYVSSVFTNIRQMLTFTEQLVDMISLGGTALAQSGSSGGAVVNMWGRVIGIVTTTSEGETTETRDLRAITMAHIDRSVRSHTGASLEGFLQRDPTALVTEFKTQAQTLANSLIEQIDKRR